MPLSSLSPDTGYCDEERRADFLLEMSMMKQMGVHPNIVSLVGACTQEEPLCLVVEHVPHGDLLHYLRDHRHSGGKVTMRERWRNGGC